MNNYKIYFYSLVLILSASELGALIFAIQSLCWECQIAPEVDPIQPLVGFILLAVSIFCAFKIYNEVTQNDVDIKKSDTSKEGK